MWDLLYRWRVRIARTLTGLLLAALGIGAVAWVRPEDPPTPPGPDMTIALTAPQPLPPSPEPPPPPEVKQDQFIDKPVRHRERTPPSPPSPVPPVPDAVPSPLPPGPPATPPGRPPRDLEEAYKAAVHQYLESIKRYPTDKEARIQQPQGTVIVYVVVARDGTLVSVEIKQSAGSILDHAAVATVRRGRFPPFPNDAWPGEATVGFDVPLEFKAGS